MDIKRVLTGVIGLPLIILIGCFGNKYIIDVAIAIVMLIASNEYINCIKKKSKPISWILYVFSILIAFIHIIPIGFVKEYLLLGILSIVATLFLHIIATDMKINISDVAFTLLGLIYIVGFSLFVPLLYGIEDSNGKNIGKLYVVFLFLASWGTDVFAYLFGKHFGKHKFSKISPKKSIEGCIGGTLGGVVLVIIYAIILNTFGRTQINYLTIGLIGLVLSLLGQIGDFSASTIKRYSEIKDFSNLIPGHGGMIDRIDSVIFAAPFAYYLLTLLII